MGFPCHGITTTGAFAGGRIHIRPLCARHVRTTTASEDLSSVSSRTWRDGIKFGTLAGGSAILTQVGNRAEIFLLALHFRTCITEESPQNRQADRGEGRNDQSSLAKCYYIWQKHI